MQTFPLQLTGSSQLRTDLKNVEEFESEVQ